MAASKKKKPGTTRWYDGDGPLAELEPSEQVAHHIVQAYGDLAPSVERIMVADLTASQRLVAINLFRASLDDLDDPNRDPRRAIDTARTTAG